MSNKKNKKDYYLKLGIRKSFIMSIFVIMLGSIFIIAFNKITKDNAMFLKNAIKTQAVISDIAYKSITNKNEIEEVYIRYNVGNANYTGKLKEISSRMYVGKKIDIYYNPSNPQEFIQNNELMYKIFKYTGVIILILGGWLFIVAIKDLLLYITTLNAREIEANIEGVIEEEIGYFAMVNKIGSLLNGYNTNKKDAVAINDKRYMIKCVWEDERGNNYVFYSRKYNEPYFKKEFEKLNLKTLKVRFKSAKKYIVITEEIDNRLIT